MLVKLLTLPLEGTEIVSESKDDTSDRSVLDSLSEPLPEGRFWKRIDWLTGI